MPNDPILEELRRVRQEQAAKYGNDIKKMFAAAKKRERRSKHKLVSFAPKKKLTD